ncbi:hypothetical protein [Streptomyces rubrogriseus]|uniref:hypothetical protein n=1 Tax=Streptomyces rubrogriseus TaxID=194673 RepID=UPI00131F0C6F|nr:hypothetical protein [Streptomyces rubrogriseus]
MSEQPAPAGTARQQLEPAVADAVERDLQRRAWRQAAEAVQAAVTRYARTKRLNRYEVEARLRQLVRHTPSTSGP